MRGVRRIHTNYTFPATGEVMSKCRSRMWTYWNMVAVGHSAVTYWLTRPNSFCVLSVDSWLITAFSWSSFSRTQETSSKHSSLWWCLAVTHADSMMVDPSFAMGFHPSKSAANFGLHNTDAKSHNMSTDKILGDATIICSARHQSRWRQRFPLVTSLRYWEQGYLSTGVRLLWVDMSWEWDKWLAVHRTSQWRVNHLSV